MWREVVVAEYKGKSRQLFRVIEKNYVNPELKIAHFLADI
jgi:DNA-binding XRE family transcriptional regulator